MSDRPLSTKERSLDPMSAVRLAELTASYGPAPTAVEAVRMAAEIQWLRAQQPDEPRVRHDMYGYTCPDCGETAQMDDAHRCKSKVTDEMVNRFLSWPLPENFQPDAGISFNPEYNIEYNAARGLPPARHQPTGTNLLDYGQAKAMLEHVLGGKQPETKAEKPIYGLSGQGEKP